VIRLGTGIASQPLCPSETSMSTLRTGKRRERDGWSGRVCAIPRLYLNLDALGTKEVDTRVPMTPSTPILPEERFISDNERMEEHANLARLCCGDAIPLALLAQRTGTTTADAGSIHHTQAPIGFSAVFMWDEFLVSGAPQRPIGLESKVLPRKATSFPGQAHVRGSIARGRSGVR